MLNQDLLDILFCPKCKGEIRLSSNNDYIICDKCSLAYKLDNDMPIMLIDNAVNCKEIEKD